MCRREDSGIPATIGYLPPSAEGEAEAAAL